VRARKRGTVPPPSSDDKRAIVTPERAHRTIGGVEIAGCVDLSWLD
jgi:hypothetical protein